MPRRPHSSCDSQTGNSPAAPPHPQTYSGLPVLQEPQHAWCVPALVMCPLTSQSLPSDSVSSPCPAQPGLV